MTEHYRIVQLKEGESLRLERNNLHIDLDAADLSSPVTHDEAFLGGQTPGIFHWASGGGSYVVNSRYLIVVRRHSSAKVNPGRYSLFTGRADNLSELLDPEMLVRELFEELILFVDGAILVPQNERVQSIIDSVYGVLRSRLNVQRRAELKVPIFPVAMTTRSVSIKYQGQSTERKLVVHFNEGNDINVLKIFSIQMDISKLSAMDGEFEVTSDGLVRQGREIFLLDLASSTVRSLTDSDGGGGADWNPVDQRQMTSHLGFVISSLLANVQMLGRAP